MRQLAEVTTPGAPGKPKRTTDLIADCGDGLGYCLGDVRDEAHGTMVMVP
jgi:hypothetical protein